MDFLNSTKLDITIITAIAGYTALRLCIDIDRGFLPKPLIFGKKELLQTTFAYLGFFFLGVSILTALIVNPWWTLLFIFFFTGIIGEFVILPLLRQSSYIFSILAMIASTYLYCQFIL